MPRAWRYFHIGYNRSKGSFSLRRGAGTSFHGVERLTFRMTRRFDSLRSEVLGTSTRFGISELFYPASDQLTFYSNTLVDFTPLFLFFSVFFLFSFFFLFSPLPASELAGPRRIAGNLKLRAKHIRDESRKPGENWSPLRRSNCNERQSPRKLRFHSLRIGKLRYFQL